MKNVFAALAVCVALSAVSKVALANDAQLQTMLQRRYADMKSAMGARDPKALSALLAPGFVSVDVSGQSEDAAQMMKELAMLPLDPLKVSATTLTSIRRDGTTAVVEQRYDMKTTKTAADGAKRNIELITISEDTWVIAGGTWLLKKTETNQMDYYVNGQQVAHRVRT